MIHPLRRFRFENDISLDELFIRTGIPQSTLSRIERGVIVPNEEVRAKIATVLKIDAKIIFGPKKGVV